MPGSNARMLGKIPSLSVDSVCMDLEDSVAANKKKEARANIVNTLSTLSASHHLSVPSTHLPPSSSSSSSSSSASPPPPELLVRINPIPSPYSSDDLHALLSSPVLPHGVVVPKCESPAHLAHVLSVLSAHPSLSSRPLALIALIESAQGLLSLPAITPSPRLQALIFGGDDLASSLSLTRTPQSTELLTHRQTLVLHARAAGLQAIDIVHIDLSEDTAALRAEARQGWEWGFSGKQIVHPSQVAAVQEEMVGGVDRLRFSARVVASYAEHEERGVGAWRLDGKMIDMPTVRIAQRLLDHARACGVRIS